MKTIALDGRRVRDLTEVFRTFREELSLPAHCRDNLDSLSDCLSEVAEDVEIRIAEPRELKHRLGVRGSALLRLLQYAAESNPHLSLALVEEEEEEPEEPVDYGVE